MDEDVKRTPFRPDRIEHRLQLSGTENVDRACDGGVEVFGERFDEGLRPVVEPGDGETRAE